MAEYRTVTAVASVTRQTFNADGTVSTNSYEVTADGGNVIVIDPYISIEQTDEGAVITVTDTRGITTATIYNGLPGAKGDPGEKGDAGADGQDGADGFSPTASVSKSGNTTTITITDKDGTTSAQIFDGVGDVASVNGQTGTVVLDADDVGALPDTTVIPTKTSDLTNDSDYMSGMTILAYGKSTWNDFLTAYTAKHVVYCRASSNSNPASGSQTRMAFMAYVNNETSPTNVEFQYYRSVSTHSATQQGDQVYVYKLDKTAGWSVIVRECYTRIVAGTGINAAYSNGVLTISLA